MKPYVGITGFKRKEEIENATQCFENTEFLKNGYTMMLGFLSSYKRLQDINSTGDRSVKVNDLEKIISFCPSWSLPMIHYYTINQDNVFNEVDKLFSINNLYGCCKAVQLNVDWPSVGDVDRIMQKYNDMKIVLQLPKTATHGMSDASIVEKVRQYDGLVSYILVDPSAGAGLEFSESDIGLMKKFQDFSAMAGIAGAFSPDNVESRVRGLRDCYDKPFFIDAENNLMENNTLVSDKKTRYILNAENGFFN